MLNANLTRSGAVAAMLLMGPNPNAAAPRHFVRGLK
jgi:hypothetical protein